MKTELERLTDADQVEAMREALLRLELGHTELANVVLCDAILQTPYTSRHWPALTQAANWIQPCNQPAKALALLAREVARIEARPAMTVEQHAKFPRGRWAS